MQIPGAKPCACPSGRCQFEVYPGDNSDYCDFCFFEPGQEHPVCHCDCDGCVNTGDSDDADITDITVFLSRSDTDLRLGNISIGASWPLEQVASEINEREDEAKMRAHVSDGFELYHMTSAKSEFLTWM